MSNKHKKDNIIHSFSYNSIPTEDGVREFAERVWDNTQYWEQVITHCKLSESFIREFKDRFNISYIVYYQKVSKDFIREIMEDNNVIFWRNLCSSQNIGSEYFNEFRFKLHWTNILSDRTHSISPEEVEEHFYDILDFTTCQDAREWELATLSRYPNLTQQFINKHSKWLDWNFISCYQDLSEDFIERNQDKVNWDMISSSQKLSKKFIMKYKDKLDWFRLTKNLNIAPHIRKKVANGSFGFKITRRPK